MLACPLTPVKLTQGERADPSVRTGSQQQGSMPVHDHLTVFQTPVLATPLLNSTISIGLSCFVVDISAFIHRHDKEHRAFATDQQQYHALVFVALCTVPCLRHQCTVYPYGKYTTLNKPRYNLIQDPCGKQGHHESPVGFLCGCVLKE